MPDSDLNLDSSLAELWHEDEERKDIMLIAADSERTDMGKKFLLTLLPNYNIVEAGSIDQAVVLISAFTKIRTAIIVNFDSTKVSSPSLEEKLAHFDGEISNAPEILVTGADQGGDKSPDSRGMDSVLTMPLTPDAFKLGMMEAIAKRGEKFEKMEKITRLEVLKEFCEYNGALAEVWNKSLRNIDGLQGESAEDVSYMLADCNSIIEILKTLAGYVRLGELSNEYLRESIHSLNSKLTVLTGFPSVMKESGVLSAKNSEILTMVENESNQMGAHVALISAAYNGRVSWKKAQCSKPIARSAHMLECPKETLFCVIDDDEAILKVTRLNIEAAGGKAMVLDAKNKAAMDEFFAEGEGRQNIEVFLLDNDLGGGRFGHEFIAKISEKYPQALIIAHTGDAESLNAVTTNPYNEHGVEVVGKRHWKAISEVIRRKMKA